MKWIITGGCGFLGTNLVRMLVGQGGHSIRIIDNLSVGTPDDLFTVTEFTESKQDYRFPEMGVELIVGDIMDESMALEVCKGADVIIHLAANTGVPQSIIDPRMDCVINIIGTLNYLEAARHNNIKKFIFASSGAPLGACEPPLHEELAPHPVSPYGASKLAGEGYCSTYYHSFGIETVVLRFANVYGPGSSHKGSIVAKFIKQVINGENLEIYGDGTQTRDFIYIDDLIRAINIGVNQKAIAGEVFQIATNIETSVSELTEKIKIKLNEKGISSLNVSYVSQRQGDVKRNYSDITKSKEILGWQANVALDTGLEKTINWFLEKMRHE